MINFPFFENFNKLCDIFKPNYNQKEKNIKELRIKIKMIKIEYLNYIKKEESIYNNMIDNTKDIKRLL